MHAESGQVFRIERTPLRTVHSGEIVDPAAKKAALDRKIKAIRTALATRAVPDEEAWKLVSEYFTTETKVDIEKIAVIVTDENTSQTALDQVKEFLLSKRAVHLNLIDIGRTNTIQEERRAKLAEASERVPAIHNVINRQLVAGTDPGVVRTQVQALRIVEGLLVESPQASAYASYMAKPHRIRLSWVAPNLRT